MLFMCKLVNSWARGSTVLGLQNVFWFFFFLFLIFQLPTWCCLQTRNVGLKFLRKCSLFCQLFIEHYLLTALITWVAMFVPSATKVEDIHFIIMILKLSYKYLPWTGSDTLKKETDMTHCTIKSLVFILKYVRACHMLLALDWLQQWLCLNYYCHNCVQLHGCCSSAGTQSTQRKI